jgi:hypothetical protein
MTSQALDPKHAPPRRAPIRVGESGNWARFVLCVLYSVIAVCRSVPAHWRTGMVCRMMTWGCAALGLVVACSGGGADKGTGGANTAGTSGSGALMMTGGAGGHGLGGDSATGGAGTRAGTGTGGHISGNADAGRGAGGGSGRGGTGGAAGSSSGTGGRAAGGAGGGKGSAGGGSDCPPECLRSYTCATSCSATSFNNGCCPCPSGTIDTITCSSPGYCGTPCMGAKPDDAVVATCQAFTDSASCAAWHGTGFPSQCAWHTPGEPPCLVP